MSGESEQDNLVSATDDVLAKLMLSICCLAESSLALRESGQPLPPKTHKVRCDACVKEFKFSVNQRRHMWKHGDRRYKAETKQNREKMRSFWDKIRYGDGDESAIEILSPKNFMLPEQVQMLNDVSAWVIYYLGIEHIEPHMDVPVLLTLIGAGAPVGSQRLFNALHLLTEGNFLHGTLVPEMHQIVCQYTETTDVKSCAGELPALFGFVVEYRMRQELIALLIASSCETSQTTETPARWSEELWGDFPEITSDKGTSSMGGEAAPDDSQEIASDKLWFSRVGKGTWYSDMSSSTGSVPSDSHEHNESKRVGKESRRKTGFIPFQTSHKSTHAWARKSKNAQQRFESRTEHKQFMSRETSQGTEMPAGPSHNVTGEEEGTDESVLSVPIDQPQATSAEPTGISRYLNEYWTAGRNPPPMTHEDAHPPGPRTYSDDPGGDAVVTETTITEEGSAGANPAYEDAVRSTTSLNAEDQSYDDSFAYYVHVLRQRCFAASNQEFCMDLEEYEDYLDGFSRE